MLSLLYFQATHARERISFNVKMANACPIPISVMVSWTALTDQMKHFVVCKLLNKMQIGLTLPADISDIRM